MIKVIGMDLGDKHNVIVPFDEDGVESPKARIPNTSAHIQKYFAQYPGAAVVIEAGTHSAWISRLLMTMGHKVCIGNPRKLRAIWDADDKSDERDARILGMMYRLEPRFLHPIEHRGEEAQAALAVIKDRDQLVRTRTKLANHVRGILKSLGVCLKDCSPETMPARASEQTPEKFQGCVSSSLETLAFLNERIKSRDKEIEQMCKIQFPETEWVRQISGVGPITALTFVLTLERADRFKKSRDVGPYIGLVPRRDQSGETDKQLRITKAGNTMLRRLLVSSAQYILGRFGQDCDLRRYGERIAARGGKRAKKCAAVAVARKLAVLMHRLWAGRLKYDPLFKSIPKAA